MKLATLFLFGLFSTALLAVAERQEQQQEASRRIDSPSLNDYYKDELENLRSTIVRRLLENLSAASTTTSTPNTSISSAATTNEKHNNDNNNNNNTARQQRWLQLKNFETINSLFSGGAYIDLPNVEVRETGLWLKLQNPRCQDITVKDIRLSLQPDTTNNQKLLMKLQIDGLHLNCFSGFDFSLLFIPGKSGTAKAYTSDNFIEAQIEFASPSTFATQPPNLVNMLPCTAAIEIYDLDFEGNGLLTQTINAIEKPLRNLFEGIIEGVICDELQKLADPLSNQVIPMWDDFLEPHLGPVDGNKLDPLHAEAIMPTPMTPDNSLLDLKALLRGEDDSTMGQILNNLLGQVDQNLGALVDDVGGPTGTGQDLGINVMLRNNNLLDAEGCLAVPDIASVLYDSNDDIAHIVFALNAMRICGLDTFQEFAPLESIGRFTLRNSFKWQEISMDMDFGIEFQPSTAPNAILKDPDRSVDIKENVRVTIAVKDIEVVASVLIAIREKLLLDMPLGAVLQTSNLLPCILSVLQQLELTGLHVTVAEIPDPILSGFRDKGMERVLSQFLQGMFYMYRPTVLTAIPNLFQGSIRDLIQESIFGESSGLLSTNNPNNSGDCTWTLPEGEPENALVDFRKMFASDSSESAYGDVPRLAKEMLDSMLLSVDEETGTAGINGMIASFTEGTSGKSGLVQMSGPLFSMVDDVLFRIGVDELELAASDFSIDNMDTIKSPMVLLQPNETSGVLLDNNLGLGGQSRPLQLAMRTLIALSGDPMLSSSNLMDVALEIADPDLFFVLLAKIGLKDVMTLPLGQMANINCWLSTVDAPALDSRGMRLAGEEPGLGLDALVMALSQLRLDISCANDGSGNETSSSCSSGMAILPNILDVLNANEITSVLQDRLVDFSSFLLTSDFTQTYVDRMLATSSEKCPEHPNFLSAEQPAVVYDPVPFPPMSRESLETMAFTALYALETAVVVVFESHSAYPALVVDPLSAQKELDLPSVSTLIDFTDLTTSVGAWADAMVDQLRSYVQDPVDDTARGGRDLGLNVLLRSFLLDDSGTIAVDLGDVQFGGDDFELSLGTLRIKGLDTMTKLDVLQSIGPQTFRNQVDLQNLRAELDLVMKSGGNDLKFTIHLEVEDIAAAVSGLLAIDMDALGNLELGQMLDTSRIFKCVLSALPAFSLPELNFSIGKIVSFGVEGFEDTSLGATVDEMTSLLLNSYKDMIASNFTPFLDYTIKAILNNWFDYLLAQESNVSCPKFAREAAAESPTFLDFRDLLLSQAKAVEYGATGTQPYGDMIRSVVNFVKDNLLDVDPETGLSSLNSAVVRKLTESQSSVPGRLSFPGSLFDQSGRIQLGGLDASFSFKAYDAYIDNVDTIGAPLSILDPIVNVPTELNNTASVGVVEPLQAGVRLFISLGGKGDEIKNDMQISLDLYTATVILTTLFKISQNAFVSYRLEDLSNTDCLLTMIPSPLLDARGVRVEGHERTAGLAELAISVAKMNLNINCIECSGPGMNELEDLLSTPEASDAATATVNDIFGVVTELLGGTFMQVQIDRMLNEARQKCPSSPEYNPSFASASYEAFEAPEQQNNSIEFLIMLGTAVGFIVVALLVITLAVKMIVRRRHRKWLATVTGNKAILLHDRQTKEQKKEAELNNISKSMFTSPEVPLWLRLLMPLIILGNIAFFLSGHLSLAATVNIEAQLAGQAIVFDNFFEFSMLKSTVEIWNAGGKELAILILIFSGIWPYTKQLITLALWFTPPRMVSISKRESILLWLDALAKWSMVDIMTLIVTIAGFRVSIQSPDVGFLPENLYSIDLLVAPLWGVYANMIAQIISQISSHFIIHYHRRIEERASQEYDRRHGFHSHPTVMLDEDNDGSSVDQEVSSSSLRSDSPTERLYQHTFSRPHRGESDKLTTRRGVNTMLIFVGCSLSVLVLVGCIVPSFSIEVLGMIGIMVESGQGFREAQTEHSVFSVINMLFEQAAFSGSTADYVGLGSLSALLIFTVLLVPIALSLVLLYQWMHPLSTRRRYRCEVLVETLQAWQYADVYLVSVIVASWQLGPVSEFMVNAYCGGLEETFAQLAFYGIMKEEDAQCFKINSSIEDGSFILATGAVLLALMNTFVTRAVGQYFRDKENEARRGQDLAKLEALSSDSGAATDEDAAQAKKELNPVPVLFTDTFRWFLIGQDVAMPSSRRLSSNSNASSSICQEEAAMAAATSVVELLSENDATHRRRNADETFVNAGIPRPSSSGSMHYDVEQRSFSSYQYSPDDDDDAENHFMHAGMPVPIMDASIESLGSEEEDMDVNVDLIADVGVDPFPSTSFAR